MNWMIIIKLDYIVTMYIFYALRVFEDVLLHTRGGFPNGLLRSLVKYKKSKNPRKIRIGQACLETCTTKNTHKKTHKKTSCSLNNPPTSELFSDFLDFF